MQTRSFGPTGYTVSAIGLGGMPLSLRNRPPEADGVRVIHAALDAGMTLIDTADVYCIDDADIGHNERIIAKAVATWPGRNTVHVATKCGLERPRGDWVCNGRPDHIVRACEQSLRALGVDCIDIYQLHAPDDAVPYADTIGALADLRTAGKVRHVGLSNVTVAEIREAQEIVPVVSVQNRCHPLDRRSWSDGVLAECEQQGLAFLPYSPVGGDLDKEKISRHPTLRAVGERNGASVYEVALAWLLAKSPAMIPIPGASRIASAQSSARAGSLVLSPQDMEALNGAFPT